MATIKTIQERLQEKAEQEALLEATRLFATLPYLGDEFTLLDVGGKPFKVRNYSFQDTLMRLMTDRLYVRILQEKTEQLLKAVEVIQNASQETTPFDPG